jgi:carbonic anhydrase
MRLSMIAVFAVACGSGTPPAETPHKTTWTYESVAHWADLDPAFAGCKGTHQSPIDVPDTHEAGPAFAAGTYAPFPVRILNNGHAIQVEDTAASSLVFGGVTYALAQFHFHAPSEHTLAGKSFDAEAHFVHKSADGKLLVIGMFIRKGNASAELAPVFDAIPTAEAASHAAPGTVDVTAILPRAPHYAHYAGSLTTPPCSEGVSWFVEKSVVLEISDAQLMRLRAAVHGDTNRPVQPIGDRTVVEAHL